MTDNQKQKTTIFLLFSLKLIISMWKYYQTYFSPSSKITLCNIDYIFVNTYAWNIIPLLSVYNLLVLHQYWHKIFQHFIAIIYSVKPFFLQIWYFIENISNIKPLFLKYWYFVETISNVKPLFNKYRISFNILPM